MNSARSAASTRSRLMSGMCGTEPPQSSHCVESPRLSGHTRTAARGQNRSARPAGQRPDASQPRARPRLTRTPPWDSHDKSGPRPNGAWQPVFAKPRWGIGYSIVVLPRAALVPRLPWAGLRQAVGLKRGFAPKGSVRFIDGLLRVKPSLPTPHESLRCQRLSSISE